MRIITSEQTMLKIQPIAGFGELLQPAFAFFALSGMICLCC